MNDLEDGIIILDEVSMMRRRISSMLQGYNFRVFEASYDVELFNIIAEENINIRLILMDLGYDINKGFETLAKLKEKKPNIPIFVITSNNKRSVFIRAMAEGATDYILKPFDDEFLLEKILSVVKVKYQIVPDSINISFNIHSYLNAELKKAQKGKYEITVLMCTLYEVGSEINNLVENKYIEALERFYVNCKNHLWETDVFERYGTQTFIGIFPYCTVGNVEIINNKIMDYFGEAVKVDRSLSNLNIAMATITYPVEDLAEKELLLTLGMRMNKSIIGVKIEENPIH
ncbi:MAG: transcriptional regulator [Herbinix sp.]|nr:transcriptional regulator [Herbinix sp.]